MRTLVAGIDCSTQSTKVLVCDAGTGQVVRTGSAPHPDATEVDPAVWAAALESASSGGLLDGVAAIAVGGQQHGMVALDETGAVVRPALLWNDIRSAGRWRCRRRRRRRRRWDRPRLAPCSALAPGTTWPPRSGSAR